MSGFVFDSNSIDSNSMDSGHDHDNNCVSGSDSDSDSDSGSGSDSDSDSGSGSDSDSDSDSDRNDANMAALDDMFNNGMLDLQLSSAKPPPPPSPKRDPTLTLLSCLRKVCRYSPDLEAKQRTAQANGTVLGISRTGFQLLLETFHSLSYYDSRSDHRIQEWELAIDPDSMTDGCDFDVDFIADTNCGAVINVQYFTLRGAGVGMAWVVENIVKPQTKLAQCALLDLFFGLEFVSDSDSHYASPLSSPSGPLVGPVSCFHSYTWNVPVVDTFLTVTKFLQEEEKYMWWDIFCQNQHIVGDVGLTFTNAISQIQTLYFSIPDIRKPQSLSRVWCLYEIMTALLKPTVTLQLVTAEKSGHERGSSFESLPGDLIVSVTEAQCFMPEDKVMLMGRICAEVPGGVAGMDDAIRSQFLPLFYSQMLLDGACENNIQLVEYALSAGLGVDINYQNYDGWTALHRASWSGAGHMVTFLVGRGAEKNLKTNGRGIGEPRLDPQTPLALAQMALRMNGKETRRNFQKKEQLESIIAILSM